MQTMAARREFSRDAMRGDPIKALAAGVVIQAMSDASRGSIEALDFCEGGFEDGGWMDLAGISRHEMFTWIVRGCKRVCRTPRRGTRMAQNGGE
jgi:hypothetical protein